MISKRLFLTATAVHHIKTELKQQPCSLQNFADNILSTGERKGN
jgi:hypothetical protein